MELTEEQKEECKLLITWAFTGMIEVIKRNSELDRKELLRADMLPLLIKSAQLFEIEYPSLERDLYRIKNNLWYDEKENNR